MASIMKSCVQSLLKLTNSITGMFGMGIIVYVLWVYRVWLRELDGNNAPLPWFIYATLGVGAYLCVIACSGHIAAETANSCCLLFYMGFIFLLFLLEGAVTVDIYLNRDWQEDFPYDPTGKFDSLKDFVRSNFDFCKWVGFSAVIVQALSFLFATMLRGCASDQGQYSDSDDEYAPARLPLLINQPQPYVIGEPHGPKNDSWNVRIHDKTNR